MGGLDGLDDAAAQRCWEELEDIFRSSARAWEAWANFQKARGKEEDARSKEEDAAPPEFKDAQSMEEDAAPPESAEDAQSMEEDVRSKEEAADARSKEKARRGEKTAFARKVFVSVLAEWVNMHDLHKPFALGPPAKGQPCAAVDNAESQQERVSCNKLYPR